MANLTKGPEKSGDELRKAQETATILTIIASVLSICDTVLRWIAQLF